MDAVGADHQIEILAPSAVELDPHTVVALVDRRDAVVEHRLHLAVDDLVDQAGELTTGTLVKRPSNTFRNGPTAKPPVLLPLRSIRRTSSIA